MRESKALRVFNNTCEGDLFRLIVKLKSNDFVSIKKGVVGDHHSNGKLFERRFEARSG